MRRTCHDVWLILKLPKSFIMSVASPSLRFLGSRAKFRNKESIFFNCSESATWRIFPSHIISSTCHLVFFLSLTLENNLLNLGIIGRYHINLEGTPLLVRILSSSTPLSFCLQRDSPHLGNSFNF